MQKRKDNELPLVITRNGWKFHHLGIPTTESKPGEYHIEHLGIWVSGFEESEFGIQWMRFDENVHFHPLIKTVPHLCFEVDNIEEAIIGRELLGPVNSPSEGCRVAMIVENGAPIELIEFSKK